MADERTVKSYLAALPADEAAAMKQRLDDLRGDCGCGVASMMMLGVTGSWVIHAWSNPAAGTSWLHVVTTGLLVSFVSGMIGKLMGLLLVHVRLRLTLRALRWRALNGTNVYLPAAGCPTTKM